MSDEPSKTTSRIGCAHWIRPQSLASSYPHVPVSRKADYVVVQRPLDKPVDAVGPPLMANSAYQLYRMNRRVPGPDRCSRAMVQTVTSIGAI